MRNIVLVWIMLSVLSSVGYTQVSEQFTVMSYNVLNYPNPSNNDPTGNDSNRLGLFRAIVEAADADVILLQEIKTNQGAQDLVDELNANGVLGKVYSKAPTFTAYGSTNFQIGNMCIYNESIFNFISQGEIPRVFSAMAPNGNSEFAPRANTFYELEYESSACNSTKTINFVSCHFKSGTDSASGFDIADNQRRNLGAMDLMSWVNSFSTNKNFVVAGDFNLQDDNASEPAYATMINNGNAIPMVDLLGGWDRNITADAWKYTQSTRQGNFDEFGNSGSPGGLDDRFDLLFVSSEIANNLDNVKYVAGTYETFASPNSLNADALNGSHPQANNVRDMSDHYPVIMDLEISFSTCNCQVNELITMDYPSGSSFQHVVQNNITADNTINSGANISYEAGNCILLQPGFEVDANANFHAFIGGCTP